MRCWLIAIAVNQLIGYPETLNLPISLATVLRRRTFDKKSVPKPTHGNWGIALCCLRTDVGILRQIKAFKQKCPVRPPPKFDIRRHHAQRPTQRRASSFEHSISVSSRKYGILLQPLHYNQTEPTAGCWESPSRFTLVGTLFVFGADKKLTQAFLVRNVKTL